MIIPSIDLMGGHAVQLVGGQAMELDAGDPRPLAERFRLAGEVAVIDLDAALSQGHNRSTIKDLLKIARCRVGGGIRSVEAALEWLDAGAAKVILGTAARPEILSQLPRERVIAALDAVDGEVVVEGWRTKTGATIADRMAELRPYVGGFLVTFVEREGRLGGTRMDQVAALVEAAGDARVTIAGGVTTAAEIAELDRLGADAQVGMAIYKGHLDLGDAIAAPLVSDRPDGLWPTVICDVHGVALGLAYSDAESLRHAVAHQVGAYHSRRRGLWVKGARSGATQRLLAIDLDCDRDTLRFTVEQGAPGFCHLDTWTCWGPARGLPALDRTVTARKASAPAGSYTQRLFSDPELLRAKLLEEAGELADAVAGEGPEAVAWEAADLAYFAAVATAAGGASLADVEAQLDRRALKVKRRKGDAKPGALTPKKAP
ncbi:MAG: phosphoribosyl-ATP diphosphatase [Myxococcales bacterium]|nr:phosphoribosyl-ATP diphosphatase [Myxococcales bacterium]